MRTLVLILILMPMATAFSITAPIPQAHAQVSLHVTLVIDSEVGTGGRGALFRIDPSTGERTLMSDFGNPDQGPLGFGPIDLAIDPSGDILVIDLNADINNRGEFRGALFRVDPFTCRPPSILCRRTVISDFGDPDLGPLGVDPIDVDIDPSGTIFVLDRDAGMNGRGGAIWYAGKQPSSSGASAMNSR